MVDTNATLTRGATNFLSSSSTTLTLYNCTEVIKKSNSLIRAPFPMTDSNDSIMADLLGASRDIIIDGKVAAEDVTDIYRYVRDLVSIKDNSASTLINGDQSDTGGGQIGYVYTPVASNMSATGTLTGTLQETVTVYVNDVTVTYEPGNPNLITYSMTLYEGSKTNSF